MEAFNPYLKFIVAILGAVVTGATVYYGNAHWLPILVSVATALTVFVTPNVSNTPPTIPVKPESVWTEEKP